MTVQRDFLFAVAGVATMVAFWLSPVMAQDAPLNPMKAIDKAALKSFLERPLFAPSRRPPPIALPQSAALAPAPDPIEPPPALHLLGVIHGKNDMAVVQRDGQSKATVFHTGDQIGDWVLTVFPPFGVKLRNGSRTVDYTMFGKADVRPADKVFKLGHFPSDAVESPD